MRHPIELLANRFVDRRNPMAVDVTPQGRMAIEIATPVFINQIEALGRDDDGGVFVPPSLHGRERMPDMLHVCPAGR